jgi:hypothetical protein
MTNRQQKQLSLLAHELAERQARVLIESYGEFCRDSRMWKPEPGGIWTRWYFLRTGGNDPGKDLRRSVRYLELRGMLQRHKLHRWTVRMRVTA